MVKDHSDSERKPPTATTWATLFEQQQKFFYMHHLRQDKPYHSPCYTSCGALAGKRDSSVGPISGIDPMTHRIMSRYSATELIETWKTSIQLQFKKIQFS